MPDNGQVERMNPTIKEATVWRYYYATREPLETHLVEFQNAHNFAKWLKTLEGLTPYEFICTIWTQEPNRFRFDPTVHAAGLNN